MVRTRALRLPHSYQPSREGCLTSRRAVSEGQRWISFGTRRSARGLPLVNRLLSPDMHVLDDERYLLRVDLHRAGSHIEDVGLASVDKACCLERHGCDCVSGASPERNRASNVRDVEATLVRKPDLLDEGVGGKEATALHLFDLARDQLARMFLKALARRLRLLADIQRTRAGKMTQQQCRTEEANAGQLVR